MLPLVNEETITIRARGPLVTGSNSARPNLVQIVRGMAVMGWEGGGVAMETSQACPIIVSAAADATGGHRPDSGHARLHAHSISPVPAHLHRPHEVDMCPVEK